MIITNASSLPITASGTPNVQGALDNWFSLLTIGKITKSVVNYQLSEVVTDYEVQAVLQPWTTKQLQIKEEGQRAWERQTLHVKGTDLEFCLDDRALVKGKRYRIIQKFEWQNYGYIEYQLIEDYGQTSSEIVSETISTSETTGGELGT